MQQLTVSALACPAMIQRIRRGIRLAVMGQGHEMGGHGHRVYVPNRLGRNVMRISWDATAKALTFYGNESVRIDDTVKRAFARAQQSAT